jgi:D-glycero-beta-D-manno-heptose-7-phosphate kinase
MKDLNKILLGFVSRRILVLGDVMLDHYIWGKVDRISPEAPVPVLDMQKEEYRLGGAANVALNLKALGAKVYICGVIGNDDAGRQVKELLTRQEIDASAIITDKKRPTTLKTRIGAVNQQIVRIDHENREDISKTLETAIIRAINKTLPMVDAVIIEDYNKGLLTELIIYETVKNAGKLGKMIAVDPKQKNFFNYKKVDVFKPNYGEMQKNLGLIFESEAEFDKQAKLLKDRIKCKNLVVTRGEKGLHIYTDDSKVHQIPTFAREVFDVSGAGDTVISALTLALCEGCDIRMAAIIANHAAGVVCGKIGTAVATIDEIRQSYSEHKQNS